MWLRAGVAEIRESIALRAFGALLALTHAITFYAWWSNKNLPAMFGNRPATAICWPFFASCYRLHPISQSSVHVALIVYLALAAGAIALFARRAWTTWAVIALAAATLIKLAIFLFDYRLMGNYHYMPFVATFAYLLCRQKALVCRCLIVGFYISAGSLKLNWEWLSGAALLKPPLITGWLGDVSLAYVVILELVLVLGLLSRNRFILFGTLAQVVMFHAYSWHIVGYFYPCIMFCLLALFPLCYWEGDDQPRRLTRSGWIALGLYAAAQLAPSLYPSDVALTGEGRMFAVNMLDAKSECSLLEVTTRGNLHTERARLAPNLGVRIRCEPLVYFDLAQGACRELDGGSDLDLALVGRRTTDTWFRSLVSAPNLCSRHLDYAVLHHNDWIDR